MSAFVRKTLRSLLLATVAITPLMGPGCAGPADTGPRVIHPQTASVSLALSPEHAELARELELTFKPLDGGEGMSDTFTVGADPSLLSRNYRLAPGEYEITASGRDENGDVVIEGHQDRVNVQPGNNDIALVLRPTAEDLGDLYVELDSPDVSVGFVAADGDAREGGVFRLQVAVNLNPEAEMPEDLRVEATVFVRGPDGELPLMDVPFNVDPSNALKFNAEGPADWLGAARVDIRVIQDGGLADRTEKQVNGHPSAETMEMVRAIEEALVSNEDGTLQPVREPIIAGEGLTLEGEGLIALNSAVERFNAQALEAGIVLDPAFVAVAAYYASLGYWACVLKVLKCELLTAGCIAAAPAAVIACGEVCVGTLGLGCVACVVAAVGATIHICDSALDCWTEARREGCVP
jgi:hypothetical protein